MVSPNIVKISRNFVDISTPPCSWLSRGRPAGSGPRCPGPPLQRGGEGGATLALVPAQWKLSSVVSCPRSSLLEVAQCHALIQYTVMHGHPMCIVSHKVDTG